MTTSTYTYTTKYTSPNWPLPNLRITLNSFSLFVNLSEFFGLGVTVQLVYRSPFVLALSFSLSSCLVLTL